MDVKQVIVIRRDLHMRRGKEIAQGGHASLAFILSHLFWFRFRFINWLLSWFNIMLIPRFKQEELLWLNDNWTKVCLQVSSESELDAVAERAKAAGLTAHVITDDGLTEFNGVPTRTCLAIGPHVSDKFIGITDGLKLY